ncbi:MAG: hypothetical protein PHV59_09595, partial [Victivallales bacterium]|nr:hypothetical protein [Victivallales bacterium]
MNLMILRAADFTGTDIVTVSGPRFEHLRKVLRAGCGDRIKVGLLNGKIGYGEITDCGLTAAGLRVGLALEPPEPLPVTLICALPRPQTLKK